MIANVRRHARRVVIRRSHAYVDCATIAAIAIAPTTSGSGGDTITTGKLQANVFGGGGKDKLVNRSARGATFDGGKAADKYYNRTEADVQFSGRDDGDTLTTASGTFAIAQLLFAGRVVTADGSWRVQPVDEDGDGYFQLRLTPADGPTT